MVWHIFGPKWDKISLVFPYIHSLQNHLKKFFFFGVLFEKKKKNDVYTCLFPPEWSFKFENFTCMLGKVGSNMILDKLDIKWRPKYIGDP